jgi:hypothetical protein
MRDGLKDSVDKEIRVVESHRAVNHRIVKPLVAVAGVLYGPYNLVKVCSTHKPTEWLAEALAQWTITKGAAGATLGGGVNEGPVLDSCGI